MQKFSTFETEWTNFYSFITAEFAKIEIFIEFDSFIFIVI